MENILLVVVIILLLIALSASIVLLMKHTYDLGRLVTYQEILLIQLENLEKKVKLLGVKNGQK
jgi:hypothetical protein